MRVFVLGLAILLLPVAAAAPQPMVYFLADDEAGPAAPGLLRTDVPEAANASVRPILPAVQGDLTVFAGNATPHPAIRGYIVMGYWGGPSMYDGNITATFYTVKDDVRTPITSLSFNATTDFNATALVPPDPQDIEGSLAHVQAQALAQLLRPPQFLILPAVDVPVDAGSTFLLGFHLEPASGLPVPAGAATVQYDSLLTPTFLYVPWYEPDPPRTTTTRSPTSPGTTPTIGTGTGSPTDGPAEESPAVVVPLLVAALAALALARRR